MRFLRLLTSIPVRCAVCRQRPAVFRATRSGRPRVCETCAKPKVVREDDLLRRLVDGDAAAESAGDLESWIRR